MSRVALIDPHHTTAERKALLDQIAQAFGAAPNMFRAVAQSPAALQHMFGAFGALGSGTLGAALGEQIAVAVAQRNACTYCLAAHTALGRKAGLSVAQLHAAQAGEADDPRTAAALRFALRLVDARGQIGDDDVRAIREAGFDDGQIVEVIAHVALNLFTNMINTSLDVPLDFPPVSLRAAT